MVVIQWFTINNFINEALRSVQEEKKYKTCFLDISMSAIKYNIKWQFECGEMLHKLKQLLT